MRRHEREVRAGVRDGPLYLRLAYKRPGKLELTLLDLFSDLTPA